MFKNNIYMKIIVVFFLIFTILNAADRSIQKLENDILMAENYLWLTMDEGSFT